MARKLYPHRISWDEETYQMFLRLKQLTGSSTWRELAEKMLKMVEEQQKKEGEKRKAKKRKVRII